MVDIKIDVEEYNSNKDRNVFKKGNYVISNEYKHIVQITKVCFGLSEFDGMFVKAGAMYTSIRENGDYASGLSFKGYQQFKGKIIIEVK